ncbi:hypothetical protein [Paenibacillus piri]|uniref:Uncharacterized protein n=1 Tax=Paenibacillus piri TaxID=2547395 RepID=A0A4R5KQC6_9BACL|nr:hypothetical protein [Paenibacillus piri]TDF97953.1 hypothetical protein E1757_10550 [Paenibacillus piri]
MASFYDYPISFLRQFQQYYNERKIVNHWAEPTQDSPYPSLILRFDEIGERSSLIDLELCFLPGLESFSQEGIYILQSFAVIKNNVPSEAHNKLMTEIVKINIQLPLGGFGLFKDTGVLYFKHNTIQNREWLGSQIAMEHFDRQNALIVHQLYLFIDTLLNLAEDSNFKL